MPRSIKSIQSVLLTLGLLVAARRGSAQLAKSLDIGLPFASGETSAALALVGFRVASIRPFVPGVDFSMATMPVALVAGVAVLASDLDLTYPLALGPGAILTPRVGGSVLVAGRFGSQDESGGVGGAAGYNVGVGLVGRTGPMTAVRCDFTHRHFGAAMAFSSVTIGFVWTP